MKTRINQSSYWLTLLLLLTTLGAFAQQPAIQYFRPYDQRGVNVYETPKNDTVVFDGLKLRLGANFTQGWQNITHSNNARAILTGAGNLYESAPGSNTFYTNLAGTGAPVTNLTQDPNVYGGYISPTGQLYSNSNAVYQQAGGFPLAQANFNMDIQLADGVRVSLVSYMSAHHHNEFWVKGGYFQIDKVGFMGSEFLNKLWKNLTLKVGHMEINYGDAHFRRSDGGNTMWNPFIENNLMDAFTTEIGAELYWQKNGIIAMLAMTDGEIQGSVSKPDDRKPSIYGKFGFDKKFGDIRARLTGSFYTTKSSISNTLYGGDRTGSNYQYVMEPWNATLTGNAFSGRINPGFKDNVTSIMVNPFVKFKGIELFGTYETSSGNSQVENGEIKYSDPTKPTFSALPNRSWQQIEADVVYRFGKNERYYIGAKYNKVSGTAVFGTSTSATNINQGTRQDVSVERTSFGAGWFITRNVLFKAEYVNQKYNDYPTDNILSGGKFNGLVVQGIIGF
ncbi:MAG: hypothetical protein U0289_01450 [Cyclobacteriaceae bacterium]|nr:hypothetical protein [Cytophagales bacterium]HNP76108.1 hypothetical protein [Cyclobacteriaceae bacterium]